MRLDSWGRPGLTLRDLWALLTICRCGIVTTREAFPYHLKNCNYEDPDEENKREILEVDNMLQCRD